MRHNRFLASFRTIVEINASKFPSYGVCWAKKVQEEIFMISVWNFQIWSLWRRLKGCRAELIARYILPQCVSAQEIHCFINHSLTWQALITIHRILQITSTNIHAFLARTFYSNYYLDSMHATHFSYAFIVHMKILNCAWQDEQINLHHIY